MPFFLVECNKRFHDEREPRLHINGVLVYTPYVRVQEGACVRRQHAALCFEPGTLGVGSAGRELFRWRARVASRRSFVVGCIGQAHTGDMNTML
jgi:hypothetical protein